MKSRVIVSLRRASALLGLALCSSLAMAAADGVVATRVVSYADLNLSSPQGVAALYRRITVAAEEVCGPAEWPGSRVPTPEYRDCVSHAVADAIRRVNRPGLSDYHLHQLHRPQVLLSLADER
jgi:UrcA family protein